MMDKIYAYFDDETKANLSEHSCNDNNEPWLTFCNHNIIDKLQNNGFEIANINNYQGHGIYLVSVREDAQFWAGCTEKTKKHILNLIPKKVINLARQRKIIIVIDNSSEGRQFNLRKELAFNNTHSAMRMLDLPKHTVLVVNSNKKFFNEYDNWKVQYGKSEKIAHSYMINGFYYFDDRIPNRSLIEDAILNPDSKDFNSLNRTVRHHRVDHLYMIIKNKWHKNNLVSGSYYDSFDNRNTLNSYILNVNTIKYQAVLSKNCPLHADGNWIQKNPDISDKHIFNHDLYKNSLLSVVTETAFSEEGLFITEKSFKPIVAGHPFMILGQPFILEELNKMGYQTDFYGIDQSYDTIINTRDRFIAFHDSLKKWIDTPRHLKLQFLEKSLPLINHNRLIFMQSDYENDGFKSMLSTVKEIFQGNYRN
jgi:hypothetical protein